MGQPERAQSQQSKVRRRLTGKLQALMGPSGSECAFMLGLQAKMNDLKNRGG